jgi:deazaflavin-dependent oxidoreductase (nitroreductase family)
MYGLFNVLMQRLASTRAGTWYFSKTQQRLDSVFLRIGGKRTATSILSGLPVVVVTARGAKTGKPRSVPLLYIRNEDKPDEFALVATNFGRPRYPAWYRNLKAHPEAEGTIDGNTTRYVAHEADEEEYARYWRLAANTFLGFPKYKRRIGDRRQIPIMVMRPDDANAA